MVAMTGEVIVRVFEGNSEESGFGFLVRVFRIRTAGDFFGFFHESVAFLIALGESLAGVVPVEWD